VLRASPPMTRRPPKTNDQMGRALGYAPSISAFGPLELPDHHQNDDLASMLALAPGALLPRPAL
jgi:hypothetical protein